jgi:hypothetical protein
MAKALLMMLALVACGGSSANDQAQADLDAARADWGDGLHDYSFRWQRSCECLLEATRPIFITVALDVITVATYFDTEGGVVPASVLANLETIDGVFDRIQEAIDRDAHEIVVEYSPNLGHPTTVAIDYDENTADEELSLALSNFSAP